MEDYKKQFEIFIDSIVEGGSLTFNSEDTILSEIVTDSENQIRKMGYNTPDYFIENGQTYINTEEGELPVEVLELTILIILKVQNGFVNTWV